MLTLYDYLPSQNAYKVRLLLNHLELPYRTELISIFEGEGQRKEYLSINPTGAVPAVLFEDGFVLAESNAILMYLAADSAYYPQDRRIRAKVAQWLFFEEDYIQSTVATLRHWVLTGKDAKRSSELIKMKRSGSEKTLSILNRELADSSFLAGSIYSIADMSVFAYVHLAEGAGISLAALPNIQRWISDVQAQRGFLAQTHPYSIDPYSVNELP